MNMENSRKQRAVAGPDPELESDSVEHQQGHLDLSSSPNRSSHDTSAEFRQQAHLDLSSSTNRSSLDTSAEFHKPPTLQPRLAEDSPARSSASSDRTSFTHGSSPITRSPPANPLPEKQPGSPAAAVNRSAKVEPPVLTKKMEPTVGGNGRVEEGGGGDNRRRLRLSILGRVKREQMTKRAALGFRVFGFSFSLISLCVMAADRNMGWALDSFDRYKEFRYCMAVNAIGFVYSGAQAVDLSYQLATGKSFVLHHLHYYLDFIIDQILAYLLISSSSSAATRIDDWKSNWGNDEFPNMATGAVATSFLAFAGLAFSSLISGYALCNSKSM